RRNARSTRRRSATAARNARPHRRCLGKFHRVFKSLRPRGFETHGELTMRASGRSLFCRSHLAACVVGLAAFAVPVAGVRAQDPPTTNPASESLENVEPFAPTRTSEDVPGELETIQPASGALIDWGIEEVIPK